MASTATLIKKFRNAVIARNERSKRRSNLAQLKNQTKKTKKPKNQTKRTKMPKEAYVYILFNKPFGVLYIGVTSDLIKRIYEHKNKITGGFSAKYNVDKLGYFETCGDIKAAITREKRLKGGSRKRKIELILSQNPTWRDLYYDLLS